MLYKYWNLHNNAFTFMPFLGGIIYNFYALPHCCTNMRAALCACTIPQWESLYYQQNFSILVSQIVFNVSNLTTFFYGFDSLEMLFWFQYNIGEKYVSFSTTDKNEYWKATFIPKIWPLCCYYFLPLSFHSILEFF